MAPDTWRKLLKPRLANFATLKRINGAVKVAYHSDGVITPIIPDLIEIGLDVLNPIQPACMDPAEVKRWLGTIRCFWGSIDRQHTLPFGASAGTGRRMPAQLATLMGGLILGPTHHVQLDTPMENFWAMVDTIKQTPYRS